MSTPLYQIPKYYETQLLRFPSRPPLSSFSCSLPSFTHAPSGRHKYSCTRTCIRKAHAGGRPALHVPIHTTKTTRAAPYDICGSFTSLHEHLYTIDPATPVALAITFRMRFLHSSFTVPSCLSTSPSTFHTPGCPKRRVHERTCGGERRVEWVQEEGWSRGDTVQVCVCVGNRSTRTVVHTYLHTYLCTYLRT